MSRLKILSFTVTDRCNLNCRFCSRESDISKSSFLTPEQILETIDSVVDYTELRTIAFSEGEPLCHPQIFEILDKAKSRNIPLVLNTNGTLLTQQNVKRLKECGINRLAISLDSLMPKLNEQLGRGRNFLPQLQKGIENLKKENMSFMLKTTVNRENLKEIKNIMDFAITSGANGYGISKTIPIGRNTENTHDYYLPWKEYRDQCLVCSKNVPENFKFLIDDPHSFMLDYRLVSFFQSVKQDINSLNLRGGGYHWFYGCCSV